MGSLERRVRRLEANHSGAPRETSETQEEARALGAEIRELEGELRRRGIDPFRCLWDVDPEPPLVEHIAKLEEELGRHE